jgi:hypothetical protein
LFPGVSCRKESGNWLYFKGKDLKMTKSGKTIVILAAAGIWIAGLSGCEKKPEPQVQKGPAEQAGQQLDQATARAGQELNQAAQKAGEGLQRLGEKLQNEAQDAQKKTNTD